MREPQKKVKDILLAIEAIERYQHLSREDYEDNELVQVWFLRHLQIIGEATRTLPQDIRDLAPEVPWSKIIGMRTILVHLYFEIDLDIVWEAVQVDIPNLKPQIVELLTQLGEVAIDE
ncbi:DUF86 domain-containing protein [Synechococcus sp. PCC 6312]|uniref:HepT-like ribonuclease domain-containing protein n=1 Tax=Synechococcus sp. (strain ATCC 27167 / PCC 6312) TaxID=195253 RepID=UPI00029F4B6C|nr:DUF86 domain-containing protein [Synechococcus sp. PCC 6312]AFY60095.1 hypothetical protein Syn6312_0887 [Synechococcus sp. PCC 6312]